MKKIKIFNNLSIGLAIILSSTLIIGIALIIMVIANYLNFSSTTTELHDDTTSELNRQIIINYENYINSVITTANYISETTIEYGLNNQSDELNDVYQQAVELQPDIVSIFLLDAYGNIEYGSNNYELNPNLQLKPWYREAIFNTQIYHFSTPHIQDIIVNSNTEVITVTKVIDYYINSEKYVGVIVLDLLIDNIDFISKSTNLGDSGHLLIIDNDNTLIYSSNDSCINDDCESILLAKELIVGGKNVRVDNTDMYLSVNTLSHTRWRVATFVNNEFLATSRQNALILSGVILIATLFVSVFVASLISRRITSPISELISHMAHLEEGTLYQKIELEGQREVVVLANRFNNMIEEIRGLLDKLVTEQKEKRKSELKALQTQINPHFLYNTLDSIMYLSEQNKNEQVIEMVSALSKFFRISISRGKNIISLKEELEHAKNYLLIQRIRYNKKFTFQFEVDKNMSDLKVVKLLLQPLIENAIYHGISTEYDNGIITIRTYIQEDKAILEVEDDGFGISQEGIEELYNRIRTDETFDSVGLKNVYQRLKIYYGDNADMEIVSELDEKTIFRLVIPVERG